jgi:hypothetical protein
MLEAGTLRVLTFEAQVPEPVIDAALRDQIIPELSLLADISHCFAARRGLAGDELRVIATVWQAGRPVPESPEVVLVGAASRDVRPLLERAQVDVLPIEVHARFSRPEEARILRVFRGHVTAREMDAYLVEARTGMLADASINSGLTAFYLATRRPDDFVTVSAWTSWSAIELATGGDVRRPFVTRNSARLAGHDVAHFEIVGEGVGPDAASFEDATPPNS